MTTSQLHEFARMGAQARLRTIQQEQQAILRVFPELQDGAAPARHTSPAPRGRRRRMSAAERKAVGRRMRAYWAKRRAEKTGSQKAVSKQKRKGGMSAAARKRQGERMKAYWTAKRAQKVDGTGAGTQSETAGQNGAPTSKGGRKAGAKQGRKK
jgi:hypothetical protein